MSTRILVATAWVQAGGRASECRSAVLRILSGHRRIFALTGIVPVKSITPFSPSVALSTPLLTWKMRSAYHSLTHFPCLSTLTSTCKLHPVASPNPPTSAAIVSLILIIPSPHPT